MAGLTNIFLDQFLSQKCHCFAGVYSVDLCPKKLKGRYNLVINLSESGTAGSHFVAVHVDKKNLLWYFDSFALPPPLINHHLIEYLTPWLEKGKIVNVLNSPIQDFDSLFCGWYAAAFCLFSSFMNYDPSHFHLFFDKENLKNNEKIVQHLLEALCNKI